MAGNDGNAPVSEVRTATRRASVGRVLAGFAVFGPVLLILGAFVLLRGNIYNHPFPGAKWPWIVADVALLLIGVRMMRGEDL